jgi:hypothetical protein
MRRRPSRLDLDMLGDQLETFRLREAGDGRALRLDAEAGLALPGSRNADVGNERRV